MHLPKGIGELLFVCHKASARASSQFPVNVLNAEPTAAVASRDSNTATGTLSAPLFRRKFAARGLMSFRQLSRQ